MPKTPKDLAAAARAAQKRQEQKQSTKPDPISLEEITGERPLQAGILRDTPCFSVKEEYHITATKVAAALPPDSLYRLGDEYVTLERDPLTHQLRPYPMSPARFCTWLGEQRICYFVGAPRKDSPPPRTSISPAFADILLSSDVFRETVPIIDGIEHTRLPVITGQKKIAGIDPGTGEHRTRHTYQFAPAPVGYDPQTKRYTVDSVPLLGTNP